MSNVDNIKRLGDSIIENAIRQTETVNQVIKLRQQLEIAKTALEQISVCRYDSDETWPKTVAETALEKLK